MPASDGPTGGLTMGTGSAFNDGTHLLTGVENSFTVELWVKPPELRDGAIKEAKETIHGLVKLPEVIAKFMGCIFYGTAGMAHLKIKQDEKDAFTKAMVQ